MVKLTADNIEMRFGERLLYRFQHLSLAQNQTIHLQGDNGSGKTTLMKMFAGLIAPSSGEINIQGADSLPWWRRNPLLGKAVYLHQHPYLFEGSVAANLSYVHSLCEGDKATIMARTEQAAKLAQLDHLMQQNAANLSGGERQRLAIARAWIMQPKLLMLDEPTSNMDKLSQELVLTLIKDLQKQGTGMLISSHQACVLTQLCNQMWKIEQQGLTSTQHTPTMAKYSNTGQSQEFSYVTAS
ncbi:ABC transporter ATP-binding protein [Shewanella waksmanii]|uniref:ABC transporter ATP-binding protein n=1 Tax=Shewanella waksmanii TaxID=213783 RepID=UPI00049032E6|nr:energy-coupling factor ABC transporter ATP-binding protein [Shewanella waksmanii]